MRLTNKQLERAILISVIADLISPMLRNNAVSSDFFKDYLYEVVQR